jgi:hypothetical protein
VSFSLLRGRFDGLLGEYKLDETISVLDRCCVSFGKRCGFGIDLSSLTMPCLIIIRLLSRSPSLKITEPCITIAIIELLNSLKLYVCYLDYNSSPKSYQQFCRAFLHPNYEINKVWKIKQTQSVSFELEKINIIRDLVKV